MVVDTVTDIIFRFNDEIKKRDWVYTPEINNYTKEIHQIVDYANECLMNVSKTYSSVTYKLDEKLVFS